MSRSLTLRQLTSSTRRMMLSLSLLFVLVSQVTACSIPVFRYALERWPADLFEVDVFYRDKLTPEQRARVSQLEDQSLANGGTVNWEVVLCRMENPLAEDLETVRASLGEVTDPVVVLRRPGGRRGSPTVWQGPLSGMTADLWTSPARTTLIDRLASGDSVVWLVFQGGNSDQSQKATKLLQSQFSMLADEITLPAGVGLPGSELLSPVPLAVRFSVMEVDDRSPSEAVFRQQILSGHPQPMADDATLIVPVFGRGRALAVLKAGEIDEAAVEESTRFLCGACSCQVKQGNPGFDLLLNVDWEQRLWGETVTDETEKAMPAGETVASESEPALVPIPTGQSAESPVNPPRATGGDWSLAKAAAGCILILNLLWIVRRRSQPRH